jgi:tRNA-dihydrouridine synthase 4
MAEGFGAHLINHPQLMADMVRTTRARANMPVSVKIRIHDDIRTTVNLAQQIERAGAIWLTVHGRTAAERHTPVHYDAIKTVRLLATSLTAALTRIAGRADTRVSAHTSHRQR